MERVAEGPSGESIGLADQTTAFPAEMFWYQMEKLKRFGEVGRGRNPAAKREFGETRVRFSLESGPQGESEAEKAESVFWAEEGGGCERMKQKKKKKNADMVLGIIKLTWEIRTWDTCFIFIGDCGISNTKYFNDLTSQLP